MARPEVCNHPLSNEAIFSTCFCSADSYATCWVTILCQTRLFSPPTNPCSTLHALPGNHPLSNEAIFSTATKWTVTSPWWHVTILCQTRLFSPLLRQILMCMFHLVTILCQTRLFSPPKGDDNETIEMKCNHPLSNEAIFSTELEQFRAFLRSLVTILCQTRLFSPRSRSNHGNTYCSNVTILCQTRLFSPPASWLDADGTEF